MYVLSRYICIYMYICIKYIYIYYNIIYIYIYICIYVCMYYTSRMRHKVNFWSGVFPALKSEFSLSKEDSHIKVKEPRVTHDLPTDRGRIYWFTYFPRALALCEMGIASFSIWTRVTLSILDDGNHWTTSLFTCIHAYINVFMYVCSVNKCFRLFYGN